MRRPLHSLSMLIPAALLALSSPRESAAQAMGMLGTEIFVKASNSSAYKVTFEDVLVSSVSIKSPRDVASGQASGKRQHLPLSARSTETAIKLGPLSQFANVPSSTSNVPLTFAIEIGGASAGWCKVEVSATLAPGATRLDLQLGDVARFFDDAGKPKAGACKP